MKIQTGTFLLAGLLLSACSTMETQSGDPVSGDARVGNYYYLPRGMVRVVGEVNQGAYKITISRFNVPDVRKRYFLKQNMNAFFDDHTVLEVNEQGLLTTTNVDSEDKTPAVIDKVVETVVSVAKISAHLGQRVLLDDTGAVVGPLPFNCTFDPLNATQVAAARGKVSAAGFELQVSDGGGEQAKDPLPGDKLSGRGVFYRPPRLVDVSISAKAKDKPVLEQTVVRVPDPNQVAVLDLGRPFLVKKTTNLEFVGGDLKKVDYHKPSEALAAVSIPASILAKVADAIPSIIQIQDSRANAALKEEKAYLDAQKAVIDARLALRSSQQSLAESEAEGGSGTRMTAEADISDKVFLTPTERKELVKAAQLQAEAARKNAENAVLQAEAEATRIDMEAETERLNAEAANLEAKKRMEDAGKTDEDPDGGQEP